MGSCRRWIYGRVELCRRSARAKKRIVNYLCLHLFCCRNDCFDFDLISTLSIEIHNPYSYLIFIEGCLQSKIFLV